MLQSFATQYVVRAACGVAKSLQKRKNDFLADGVFLEIFRVHHGEVEIVKWQSRDGHALGRFQNLWLGRGRVFLPRHSLQHSTAVLFLMVRLGEDVRPWASLLESRRRTEAAAPISTQKIRMHGVSPRSSLLCRSATATPRPLIGENRN